ncbi:MAG: hypothetical protein IPK53_19410 [bacterium]|nr:hypothetical protein [bacterium]
MQDVAQAITLSEAHQDPLRQAQSYNLMADLVSPGSYDEMHQFYKQGDPRN